MIRESNPALKLLLFSQELGMVSEDKCLQSIWRKRTLILDLFSANVIPLKNPIYSLVDLLLLYFEFHQWNFLEIYYFWLYKGQQSLKYLLFFPLQNRCWSLVKTFPDLPPAVSSLTLGHLSYLNSCGSPNTLLAPPVPAVPSPTVPSACSMSPPCPPDSVFLLKSDWAFKVQLRWYPPSWGLPWFFISDYKHRKSFIWVFHGSVPRNSECVHTEGQNYLFMLAKWFSNLLRVMRRSVAIYLVLTMG